MNNVLQCYYNIQTVTASQPQPHNYYNYNERNSKVISARVPDLIMILISVNWPLSDKMLWIIKLVFVDIYLCNVAVRSVSENKKGF